MWSKLSEHFEDYPAQRRVAQLLLGLGLSISHGRIFAGPVEVSDSAVARAAGVDRRVVRSAVQTIEGRMELREVFERLLPTCHLKEVAWALGWGVLEIVPTDAHTPGILAGVAQAIASREVSIRQAIVDDPDLVEEPRLYVVTESPIPAEILDEIRSVRGVKSVVLHSSGRVP